MTRVLILCTGNSCRSQMAEAILRSIAPALDVHSAGTSPARIVHPMAIRVVGEIGLDISDARPKSLDEFLSQSFEYVITVCDHAKESCPTFTGSVAKQLHIGFDDPAMARGSEEEILMEFRRVRDEIREAFRTLLNTELA